MKIIQNEIENNARNFRGKARTDGRYEVDDDEGVEHGDDGRADGCNNIAQALEAPKEPEDPEGPKHLQRNIGDGGIAQVCGLFIHDRQNAVLSERLRSASSILWSTMLLRRGIKPMPPISISTTSIRITLF